MCKSNCRWPPTNQIENPAIFNTGDVFTGNGFPEYEVEIDHNGAGATFNNIVDPGGTMNNGTYTNVTTTGGTGSGLQVDVTIASGTITVVTPSYQNGGNSYVITDTITLSGLSAAGGGGDNTGTFDVLTIADTFKWRVDGGTYVEDISITGASQDIQSNGITVIFGTTTGHTITDAWNFVAGNQFVNWVSQSGPGSGNTFIGNTEVMGNNGNVTEYNDTMLSDTMGIGTITPDGTLDLEKTGSDNNYLYMKTATGYNVIEFHRNGTAQSQIWTDTNGDMRLRTYNGSTWQEGVVVDSGGNVGIGTTSPSAALDVNGAILTSSDAGSELYALKMRRSGSALTSPDIWDLNGNGLVLGAGSSDSTLVIKSGGNVGIATTSPSEKLDVNGNARFQSIGSGASAGALHYTSTGVLTTNTSDRRKKKNIKSLENPLGKIAKLRGARFEWKEKAAKGKRIGLIAQEVEKIYPELVFTNPNDGFKGIHYGELTAVLLEAVKAQQKQISGLEKKLSKLSKKK